MDDKRFFENRKRLELLENANEKYNISLEELKISKAGIEKRLNKTMESKPIE